MRISASYFGTTVRTGHTRGSSYFSNELCSTGICLGIRQPDTSASIFKSSYPRLLSHVSSFVFAPLISICPLPKSLSSTPFFSVLATIKPITNPKLSFSEWVNPLKVRDFVSQHFIVVTIPVLTHGCDTLSAMPFMSEHVKLAPSFDCGSIISTAFSSFFWCSSFR